jgi:hypothetical protein
MSAPRVFFRVLLVAVACVTTIAPSAAAPLRDDTLAPASGDPAPAMQPLKKLASLRLRLRDGTKLVGKATAFNGEGFEFMPDAASGEAAPVARTVRWLEVLPADLEGAASKILDEKRAEELLLKGELLIVAGREKAGITALERAVKLDAALKARANEARDRAVATVADAAHAEQLAKLREMSARIPKAGPTEPWPVRTRAEQEAAVATMKARAEEICRISGMQAVPIETKYFLLYAAAKPEAVKECARCLDAMYEAVLELFGIPPGLNLFWGKAVVLLQPNQEKFRLVEQAAFGQMTPPGVVGLCHQIGPQVFVNIFWIDDQDLFDSTLIHEAVHGIVHRYHSPARLPDWANEGLSEYIAAITFKTSPVDKSRRPQALDFIRSGGSVADVMRLSYRNRTWPGPEAIGYAVGYVVVELMIRQQPQKFGAWLRAIKGGKDWETALREDFGYTVEAFAQTATDFYRRSK